MQTFSSHATSIKQNYGIISIQNKLQATIFCSFFYVFLAFYLLGFPTVLIDMEILWHLKMSISTELKVNAVLYIPSTNSKCRD